MEVLILEKVNNKQSFRPIRRHTKELTDQKKIEYILNKTSVGYLGLVDEEGTYVVPLNYVWYEDKIYFHGSNQGRKYDALLNNHTYCFTAAEEYGTVANPVPAHTGTAYTSVMVFGKIKIVTDLEEAVSAMQAVLDKYVPGYYSSKLAKKHLEEYRSSLGSPTIVHCLIPERISAKEAIASYEDMYFPGSKQTSAHKKN